MSSDKHHTDVFMDMKKNTHRQKFSATRGLQRPGSVSFNGSDVPMEQNCILRWTDARVSVLPLLGQQPHHSPYVTSLVLIAKPQIGENKHFRLSYRYPLIASQDTLCLFCP